MLFYEDFSIIFKINILSKVNLSDKIYLYICVYIYIYIYIYILIKNGVADSPYRIPCFKMQTDFG